MLDLTAEFGVKTNAVLTPISQLSRRAKLDLLVVDTITHAKNNSGRRKKLNEGIFHILRSYLVNLILYK